VQTAPAGVFGYATGLIRGSNGNQQQGITLVDEGAGQLTVDQQTNLDAGQARELWRKPVDIGASKRTADVPAATALARLHKDVNTAAGVLNALGKSVAAVHKGIIQNQIMQESDVQAVHNSKSEDWAVVNRAKQSPRKVNTPVNNNQSNASKNIRVSNSFDVLMNETILNKEGTTVQHGNQDAASKNKPPGSEKKQQLSKNTGGQVAVITDMVPVAMASISQASTNELSGSKDQQGATSAIVVKRKTWAERVQEEEEYYADSIHDDSDDEAAQISATPPSKDEAAKVQSEQVSNSTDSGQKRRGLSPNAPAFVPSKQQQIVAALEGVSSTIQAVKEVPKSGQQCTLSAAILSSMHNVDATGSSSAMAAKYNLTPTNILHALVSHDIDTLRAGQSEAWAGNFSSWIGCYRSFWY
ncbi:hypothetical protein A4A49_04764, partial [Nicotiana attenuata]